MKAEIRTRIACFMCCSLMITTAVSAANPRKGDPVKNEPVTVIKNESVNNFIADRVNFKKEMALKELSTINTIALSEAINMEATLYPADELYGSRWENRFVDPTQGLNIALPDSFGVDCSSFVLPIVAFTKITSKYGPRRRRMHKGIDLKVQIGDTIRSAFEGRVRIISYERRGYGKYVVIRHPNGLETIYGHLSGYIVKENDYVRAGDPIGLGGNTGRSTGSHLHFETRFLGQAINPAEIIDFENSVPLEDTYVFRNVKVNGRKSNIYTSSDKQMVYHRVKSGDTLGKIARMYGTTIKQLCALNGLKETSLLRLGQAIRCSNSSASQSVEVKTESHAKTVAQKTVVKEVENIPSVLPSDKAIYHRIKSGDTLGALAVKYGTTVSKLCQMNSITPTTTLKLGRSLRCS